MRIDASTVFQQDLNVEKSKQRFIEMKYCRFHNGVRDVSRKTIEIENQIRSNDIIINEIKWNL